MEPNIFSGPASVEFQGNEVLTLIKLDNDVAYYEILGFEKNRIFVRDYRTLGLETIRNVLASGQLDEFPARFNRPAHVTVVELEEDEINIDLHDTEDAGDGFMLWVAVGMGDSLPVYDYSYFVIEEYQPATYAMVALYRRPELLRPLREADLPQRSLS